MGVPGERNPENVPAWQLSNDELLAVLAKRCEELAIATAMASLVRVFEAAATKDEAGVAGLQMAIGLTKLYSQNFAPGNRKHPFPNFNMAVDEIFVRAKAATPAGQQVAPLPPPVRRPSNYQPKYKMAADLLLSKVPFLSPTTILNNAQEADTYTDLTIADIYEGLKWLKQQKLMTKAADGWYRRTYEENHA